MIDNEINDMDKKDNSSSNNFLMGLLGFRDWAFTLKSISFGLLGILIISGLAGFNDNYLKQNFMVGNHFPIGAYFLFFCLTFFWNFIFSKIAPALTFKPKELAVVLGMSLVACWVPTSGLYRYFQRQLICPWYYLEVRPEWKENKTMDYLPDKLFPLGGADKCTEKEYDEVYMGFIQGMAKGDKTIGLSEIPFKAWAEPCVYWGALFVFMALAVLGLTLLIHRQWIHHEQVSYPIATVASSLIKQSKNRAIADIFYNRLFWWGVLPVLAMYMLNYLSNWFPTQVPSIELSWNIFASLKNLFPVLKQSGFYGIEKGKIFFVIVGIAFFVPSEVGLTMGLTSFFLAIVGANYYLSTGAPITRENLELFRAGSGVGLALILLYTGRTYYLAVLKKAFGFGRPLAHEKESVLAARILVLSVIGMVGTLYFMGLDWFVATLYVGALLLFFLVFTRIVCESGIPFLQLWWWPGIILTKLAGPAAIGAGPLVFLYYIGTILVQDPRETLMPYVATSMKVAEDVKVSKPRMIPLLTFSVVIALAVGFVVILWTYYNYGCLEDRYASISVARGCIDKATKELSFLTQTGQLEKSIETTGPYKLLLLRFNPEVFSFFLLGLFLVVAFSLIRFRFAKWPIHPILFLVWGVYATYCVWFSFLVGWAIKQLVVKFGGGKAYQELKPIFIGLIVGELLAVGIIIVTAFIYYFVTGLIPVSYHILPG